LKNTKKQRLDFRYIVIIICLLLSSLSCTDNTNDGVAIQHLEILDPAIDCRELETDYIRWWTYYSRNINLSSDFAGLTEQSEEIDKEPFLDQLTSGNYIPLRLSSKNGTNSYKLHSLDSLAIDDIRTTIRNESFTHLTHFHMEGTKFPEFDFTDLDGNQYTSDNTRGKILVVKTWFINCQACIAEFPVLNELVDNCKSRSDIIFLSLAIDAEPELEKFLQKKDFAYPVISDQKDYIVNTLGLQIYPTHIIVDKNGTILKVVNEASQMISYLENKSSLMTNSK